MDGLSFDLSGHCYYHAFWHSIPTSLQFLIVFYTYIHKPPIHPYEMFHKQLITDYNIIMADWHHKLIRWRLVTHGGIDGYSRLIVYLKYSVNNKSSTVYVLFLEAIRRYGLPSRPIREEKTMRWHCICCDTEE